MLKFKVLKDFTAGRDYKAGQKSKYHEASVRRWAVGGYVQIIKDQKAPKRKVIEGPEIKK